MRYFDKRPIVGFRPMFHDRVYEYVMIMATEMFFIIIKWLPFYNGFVLIINPQLNVFTVKRDMDSV